MPLAHLLAPQIAKKAKEIEAALPGRAGYLQRPITDLEIGPVQMQKPVDLEIGPVKMQPQVDLEIGPVKMQPQADQADLEIGPVRAGYFGAGYFGAGGRDAGGRGAGGRGAHAGYLVAGGRGARVLSREANTPLWRNAVLAEAVQKHRQKNLHFPTWPAPGAPRAAPETFDELGRPVYEDVTRPATPVIVRIAPGDVINERGEKLDLRGRPIGFLQNDPNIRTLERSMKDVNLEPKDAADAAWLEELFGPHLQAVEDNRDANGMPTDKFPEGYFDGMSKLERENIIRGVKALRKYRRGVWL